MKVPVLFPLYVCRVILVSFSYHVRVFLVSGHEKEVRIVWERNL